jgi:hypothetical protein
MTPADKSLQEAAERWVVNRATLNGWSLREAADAFLAGAEWAKARIKRLETGLSYYADGWHYRQKPDGDYEIENGDLAFRLLHGQRRRTVLKEGS